MTRPPRGNPDRVLEVASCRWLERRAGALVLTLRLQPRASQDGILEASRERLRVQVSAAAVDDAANRALSALLAREFDASPSRVSIVTGARSREKKVRIEPPWRLPAWIEASPEDQLHE